MLMDVVVTVILFPSEINRKTQSLTLDLIANGLNLVNFSLILTSVQTEGEQRLTVKMRLMTVSRF